MDYYFLVITIMDVFALGIMCIHTKYSETLSQQKRNWFIRSFALIIVISVLEVITIVVDHGPASFRWVNIIANYLGFGLTPAVSIFLAFALEKNRSITYAIIVEGVYLVLFAVTFPLKPTFSVDQNNQYMRGDFFGIFLAVYFAGTLYFLAMTLRVAARYQNKSRTSIYLIAALLLLGTMVQVAFPQVHVTWLYVSLLSILYFTYYNGMWQQLDELTGLLNQKSYLNQTASLSQDGTLVVFDIDDFKHINDNYGHLLGDKCLEEVAACIKKAYSKDGFCYRIGGDEFCVLLNANTDQESCYRRLIEELNLRREEKNWISYRICLLARHHLWLVTMFWRSKKPLIMICTNSRRRVKRRQTKIEQWSFCLRNEGNDKRTIIKKFVHMFPETDIKHFLIGTFLRLVFMV